MGVKKKSQAVEKMQIEPLIKTVRGQRVILGALMAANILQSSQAIQILAFARNRESEMRIKKERHCRGTEPFG